jgi:6-phosphogluconate dehydrogenase
MELGFIGLGKMGLNMVTRLRRDGHRVVVYDRSSEAIARAEGIGADGADSLENLVKRLAPPRAVWVMVPAGAATESTVMDLGRLMSAGDAIIDGGNTNYRDDVRRAGELKEKGISYIDAGTSGGIWGLQEGYCLMVGGDADVCKRLEPVFLTLAPPDGYLRVGTSGAGHYVKMIHNGIEYGLMQAYAEGFELMHASDFHIDTAKVASLWLRGSVVRSWLLDLIAGALARDPRLEGFGGVVCDSGEGRWTLSAAVDVSVPVPVLSAALFARFASRGEDDFANKLLSAMRSEFGGHAEKGGNRK